MSDKKKLSVEEIKAIKQAKSIKVDNQNIIKK